MLTRKRGPSRLPWVPCFEALEGRTMFSVSLEPAVFGPDTEIMDIQRVVVAGDANGTPTDSPSARVDANLATSRFGGVGSIFARVTSTSGYIGTGTVVIDGTHVLTAAHVLDTNDDGISDFLPSDVTFYLNFSGDYSSSITASAITIHPDYTGFNNPSVNDDVAVITLSTPVPTGVPIYSLYTGPTTAGDDLTVVGYGRSGYGTSQNYSTDASFTVKRVGYNEADIFAMNDEGGSAIEVFRADFDGPSGTGAYGGSSLGNNLETTLGGGDSGGPSFINVGGNLKVYGINTFTFSMGGYNAPHFGSGWGGMAVTTYASFISDAVSGNTVTPPPPVAVETVDATKATYNSTKKTLTVEGTSTLGANSDLKFTVAGSSTVYDMNYNASTGKWTGTSSALATVPSSATVKSVTSGATDTIAVSTTASKGKSRGFEYESAVAQIDNANQAGALVSYWHTEDGEPGTGRGAARQLQIIDLLSLVKPAVP